LELYLHAKDENRLLNQRIKRSFHRIQMLQNAIIMLFQENNGIATERRFQKKSVFRLIASSAKIAFQDVSWRNV
jgi:hypothetical protein